MAYNNDQAQPPLTVRGRLPKFDRAVSGRLERLVGPLL